MKSKTLSKKLTLNKKTIVDLNVDKMLNVYGGVLRTTTVPVDESVLRGQYCIADTFGDSNCCH